MIALTYTYNYNDNRSYILSVSLIRLELNKFFVDLSKFRHILHVLYSLVFGLLNRILYQIHRSQEESVVF